MVGSCFTLTSRGYVYMSDEIFVAQVRRGRSIQRYMTIIVVGDLIALDLRN